MRIHNIDKISLKLFLKTDDFHSLNGKKTYCPVPLLPELTKCGWEMKGKILIANIS